MKYGVTTDYVLGLDVVLADGRPLITLGGRGIRARCRSVPDQTLRRRGPEGTLGIVTKVTLRLVPLSATGSAGRSS